MMSEQLMDDLWKSTVEEHASELCALAKDMFKLLKPHKSKSYLEVEVRLCRFTEEGGNSFLPERGPAPSGGGMRLVKAKVDPGVSADHYESIKAFCASAIKNGILSHSKTKDISQGSWRYTYSADNPMCCIACVNKKRLFVCDILVPFGTYNLRFSASTESPGVVPAAGTAPIKGYARQKARQSVIDGLFRYDTTTVTQSGTVMHEVEVEGVFNDPVTQLTESWVEELLGRALILATLPNELSSNSVDKCS